MFFNNFINNIIKSMMAVCVVANGWSMNKGEGDTLTANPFSSGSSNGTPLKPVNVGSPGQNQEQKNESPNSLKALAATENKENPVEEDTQKWSVTIDIKNLSPNDPLSALLQSGELEELRNMMINTTNLSGPTKILMIEGRLDSVCELLGSSSYAKYVLNALLSILDEITKENKEVLCYASERYINIFPTLLRCERLKGNLAQFENLISAIDLTHGKLTSPDNATDNSGTVTTKLESIVKALSEY